MPKTITATDNHHRAAQPAHHTKGKTAMTITFENKHNDKIIKVEDVKFFTTGCTYLRRTGFGVNYNDGTFNLFPGSEWRLISVRQ